jgi:hypothetical protein
MSQNPATSTNPGTTNVADEAFGVGLATPNQPVKTGTSTNPGPVVQGLASVPGLGAPASRQTVQAGPSTNAGPLTQGGSYAPGLGTDAPDQPVTVSPSQNSGRLVQGGTASPTSPNCENTIENNVVGQVYGVGSPTNVFV